MKHVYRVILTTLLGWFAMLPAETPQLINYQGRLTDKDGKPANGTLSVVFAIYAEESGGAPLWDETRDITLQDGLYNILLGSKRAFPDTLFSGQGDRYLGIKIGTEPEMTPRFQLTSVPYTMHAQTSEAISSPPVVARWYASNHKEPSGSLYKWGVERFNSSPDKIAITADSGHVEFKISGYYQICINVLQLNPESSSFVPYPNRGDIWLWKNDLDVIGRSLGAITGVTTTTYWWCRHNLSIIEYFNRGDKISVESRNGLVYGNKDSWSSLEIVRLR